MINIGGGMLTGDKIRKEINKGNITITPYDEGMINPNSYNLRLHPQLLTYKSGTAYEEDNYFLDMKKSNKTDECIIPETGMILQPGQLYIGRTIERVGTDKYIPMINGRSSGGRLGISIHICAGFGDIGFDGTWTLEITVVKPVMVYPNVEIAQVCFFKPYGKVNDEFLYKGRYQGQIAATPSRFNRRKGDNHEGE